MLANTIPRHGELYGRLRERHTALFEARSVNRRRSSAPVRLRVLLPVVERLPLLDAFTRHRLYLLVNRPRQILSLRRKRAALAAG